MRIYLHRVASLDANVVYSECLRGARSFDVGQKIRIVYIDKDSGYKETIRSAIAVANPQFQFRSLTPQDIERDFAGRKDFLTLLESMVTDFPSFKDTEIVTILHFIIVE